ncbi:MAG TPA: sulfide/dihydroorotate dehydrogenase-like FAD/NAD-binding protein, partial [Aggregatilineaceae bacterium]|nr:sulfide/dihydroorotate dehydrogenase-like FAD/NAD-binding protein [Aggregatilineaceae bacterium]
GVNRYLVHAPKIAQRRKAGQFVIVRIDERGERIPLTVADAAVEQGTITLVVQAVGKTTTQMALLRPGDRLLDVVGPLGASTHIEDFGTTLVIGGGIGIAVAHPIAQALRNAGNTVISILGARTRDLLIMEHEMGLVSDEVLICTDDGSYCQKGLVTNLLADFIAARGKPDHVFAIGPVPMMKYVCKLTKEYGIPTTVSLNPVMVDGTGMCGGCRVTVDGKTKFACVDGPDFDGLLVDFDELMQRQAFYKEQEREAFERFQHECRSQRDFLPESHAPSSSQV